MRLLVLALPLAALLTGCSGSSKTADSSATQTPLPTVTQTQTPEPTQTTEAPTPATTTPARVASSGTPGAAPVHKKPAIDGDVDGDGKPDAVRTTATVLTVVLSGTGKTVTAPIHSEAPRKAPVLGSKDVDLDGFAEIFLETAQGASTTFATPYRFDGKVLRELQLGGEPVRLGIGGSVTHGDGFRCTSNRLLEVRSADSSDGTSFTVHVKFYRLTPSHLVLVRSATSRARQGDRAVEDSYNVDCGSVGEGG